jgi:hypothetical protein
MDRKKITVCLAGAALVVGLAVVLCLAFRPKTSEAVTIDPRDYQAVIDHLTAEIEETVEKKSMDGHQSCQIDWVQRRKPKASFKLAIK